MGHIGGRFCGKLSLGMLDKPILLITFCVNFHQKALKKGVGGEAMNCESDLSLATRRGWN